MQDPHLPLLDALNQPSPYYWHTPGTSEYTMILRHNEPMYSIQQTANCDEPIVTAWKKDNWSFIFHSPHRIKHAHDHRRERGGKLRISQEFDKGGTAARTIGWRTISVASAGRGTWSRRRRVGGVAWAGFRGNCVPDLKEDLLERRVPSSGTSGKRRCVPKVRPLEITIRSEHELATSEEPESDSILAALDDLPSVSNTRLPYSSKHAPSLCVDPHSIPLRLEKLAGDAAVECLLCGKECKLRSMRSHVGKHLLLAQRRVPDKTLKQDAKVGPNPCGWCGGSEGCKTQLKETSPGRYNVLSNCKYHYDRMVYGKAAVYSASTPSTNVPIPCSLCLRESNLGRSQLPTFWKYNLIYHMIEKHMSDDDTLPPFPLEMLVSCHISRIEEKALGVPQEITTDFRDKNHLLHSDGIEEAKEELLKRERAESTSTTQPAPKRSRALSKL
ncbi:hypothetical protein NMY22_g7837 [Coprinellus aureogranulatus]|nr:hypothetical protein NMY22_g7837 [Coprinellus aureogranulatus]